MGTSAAAPPASLAVLNAGQDTTPGDTPDPQPYAAESGPRTALLQACRQRVCGSRAGSAHSRGLPSLVRIRFLTGPKNAVGRHAPRTEGPRAAHPRTASAASPTARRDTSGEHNRDDHEHTDDDR
ncbi:hypothetical protein GCM10010344_01490 [Streptomyces bluensis]|nr:hypothetical protein GCM10010344_01490 [Streptomyces bluensis]